jgi:hypothetical protein
MRINFAGGAYQTFSKNLNAQECVNFFVYVNQHGATSQLALRGTPCLKEWCDPGKYAEVRGAERLGRFLYTVIGNRVFRINSNKSSVQCTGVLATSQGSVSMAHNTTQVMIVDGVNGYIVTATTVTMITDDGLPSNPTTVTYQDGYFLVTYRNSGRVYISDLNNGLSWDGTVYFNAEEDADDTVSVESFKRDIIPFGQDTFSFWYNSGSTVPFDRKPGSSQKIGIGAKYSIAQVANTIFFLTNEFQVATLAGYQPKPVSTRSIDYQISQYERKDDAIGMGINIEGNAFYILTFPTADVTWCYNAATDFWNRLMSYPEPYQHRWRGNCHEFFADKHIVGDYKNGKLYEWDFDTFKDNSEWTRRTRTTEAIKKEGKNIFHHRLEVFFEPGVGLITGQGSDPQAMLQYSDDGGHTWSNEIWRSVGKIGEYGWRAVWNRLGKSRHRNYRITVTDPVKWVITNANLEATIGSS